MEAKTLSAGVVVVRKVLTEYVYLLLRAYNYWDFPKGNVEPGESPLEAACRETKEESGITDLQFRWGHAFIETQPYGKGKVARYYVAETSQEEAVLGINPESGRVEHHEFRWLPYEEALSLLVPRVARVLDWAKSVVEGG